MRLIPIANAIAAMLAGMAPMAARAAAVPAYGVGGMGSVAPSGGYVGSGYSQQSMGQAAGAVRSVGRQTQVWTWLPGGTYVYGGAPWYYYDPLTRSMYTITQQQQGLNDTVGGAVGQAQSSVLGR
jgi:hypothetical protein